MAGFRLPVEPVTLVVDEGAYSGVEIELDGLYLPAASVALRGLMATPSKETDAAKTKRGRELFAVLSRLVLAWNVEDPKGQPIPVTAEGFALCPPDLIATVIANSAALTT